MVKHGQFSRICDIEIFPMSQECAERRRLSSKVAEADDALYALRDRMDSNYTELIQARARKAPSDRGF